MMPQEYSAPDFTAPGLARAPEARFEPVPAVGNNMVQVSSRTYSGSCDCSQPAAETLYVDDDPANNRVTLYAYDYRNRLTAVDGEENFFEQRTYDNLDRVVQVDRRVGSAGGGLIARSKTYYDARGQIYKTEMFGAARPAAT